MERGGDDNTSPEQQGIEAGKAAKRYEQLRGDRDTWLERARRASQVTQPYLIPPGDDQLGQGEEQPLPWSGIGALGVNNLVARLALVLLPQGNIFRLTPDELDAALAEADLAERGVSEEDLAKFKIEIDKGLAVLDRATTRAIETSNDRVALVEALAHLIVGGVVLMYRRQSGMKVFHLSRHCQLRDPMGNPVEAVTCETYLYASLDPKLRKVLDAVDKANGKWQEDSTRRDTRRVKVYTHVKWIAGSDGAPGEVAWYQEVGGAIVPGTKGNANADASPWFPLRLYRVDGASYGPGYVEVAGIADLTTNEALNRAVTEGQLQAARNLVGRKPSAITSKETFAAAPNGSVIDAQPDDFFPIPTADVRDLGVAYQGLTRLEQRLARVFMLPDIRESERTTAEEVKLQIRQADQSLGAIYSILMMEFQYPYVRWHVANLVASKKMPELGDGIKPVIAVGLASLSRANDAEKLAQFALQGNQALPQVFPSLVDGPAWLRQFGTAIGVDPLLVKSDNRIQQEQAAAAEAQRQQQLITAGMGDPQKLANAGMAVQQMAAPASPDQPQPEMP